jgi:hypothetical protein
MAELILAVMIAMLTSLKVSKANVPDYRGTAQKNAAAEADSTIAALAS